MKKYSQAFTIVEIVIVIIVIGILATLVTVSYNGISNQAIELSIKSDLKNASEQLEVDRTNDSQNHYPVTKEQAANGLGLSASPNNNFSYKTTGESYCLSATNDNGSTYYVNSISENITQGSCPMSSFVVALGSSEYEWGNSIIQSTDGGYVVLGGINNYGAGDDNIFIAKYNSDVNLSWIKTWGASGNDYGYSIKQTSDGGYVITGETRSYGAGSADMFIAKYDASGNLSWSKTWGGTLADFGNEIIQISTGGYVVTGETRSYGAGGADMFIAKYDASGNLSWSKTWGGISDEDGSSIYQTSDGGYVVTGGTRSYGAGGADMFIAKYDASGNLAWSKTWGGTLGDYGNAIIQTSDGGFVVTGDCRSYGAGSVDLIIAKYDSSGNLLWNKTWGGSGADYGNTLVQTSDGGYAVASETASYGAGSIDMYLLKYSKSGNLSWNRTWGGVSSDYSFSLAYTADGGYVVTGETWSYDVGGGDMFIARYDSAGNIPGCSSPMCKSPTANVSSPTASVSSPTASVSSPTASVSSPTASTSVLSLTHTVVVAPQ